MDELKNLIIVLQLASGIITLVAAVYLARFKYSLIEDLKKTFLLRPEDVMDMPLTRREASLHRDRAEMEVVRLDKEFAKVWNEIETVWEAITGRSPRGGSK